MKKIQKQSTKLQGRNRVSAYIAATPLPARKMLQQMRVAIRAAVPDAIEEISYGMPLFRYGGTGYRGRLVYMAAFKNHVSIFAWGREVERYKKLKKYKTSKGTIQFPLGTKIPVGLIQAVTRARKRELERLQYT